MILICFGFIEFFIMMHLEWQVFKHYFEELEEESLRDNFVVVVSYYLKHLGKC